jgi:hypothetical protein
VMLALSQCGSEPTVCSSVVSSIGPDCAISEETPNSAWVFQLRSAC